ncbi:serine hydrolase [Ligilactobacillus equi]|uniref:Penicillin-binding protein n=1 Tax=Ligilactobacillus equi DSM 15833 = JCM 10991 TaxID=1423740 RepID=A0A0R1T302_9LACO|nr:serine hydrolase [Ligilactobacillus equi]KRL76214.1 penicillin-binding protein [Ligilactobacillus equi DSM 15833 = JCM 10991]
MNYQKRSQHRQVKTQKRQRHVYQIGIFLILGLLGITFFTTDVIPTPQEFHLRQAWKSSSQTYKGQYSIAIFSEKNGQTYTYTNRPFKHDWVTASTVKVAVLVALLHQEGGALSGYEATLARQMIENSDNDATTTLLKTYLGGYDALNQVYEALGMKYTHTPTSSWGLTTTTPKDQLILLKQIFQDSDYLSTSAQTYSKALMANVEADQNWGISAGSDHYYLKNGWLPDDKGHWYVNSIGYIPSDPGANNGYLIAVYTQNNASLATGENQIENLAKVVPEILQ